AARPITSTFFLRYRKCVTLWWRTSMTETSSPTPAIADMSGLSDAERVVATKSLERAGFSAAQIEKASGGSKSTEQPVVTTTPQSTPAPQAGTPHLSPDGTIASKGDAIRWADRFIQEHPAHAEAVKAAIMSDYGVDLNAGEQSDLDRAFGVPREPSEYNINLHAINPDMEGIAEVTANFQNAFARMHIPGPIAQTLVETLVNTSNNWDA